MRTVVGKTFLTLGILGCAIQAAALEVVELRRVSVASDGTQALGESRYPAISSDGLFVSFASSAENLIEGDTNGVQDVFVHDVGTGLTSRVSIASDGTQANGPSSYPAISENGNHIAFRSDADNLIASDLNGVADIFVHDLTTGETTRVNIASDGSESNNIETCPVFFSSICRIDISDDGQLVLFASSASNLVIGDTNGVRDIFVHDRASGETTRVSESSGGDQISKISDHHRFSGDGRFVVFITSDSELGRGILNGGSEAFVKDRATNQLERISDAPDGSPQNGVVNWTSISDDGQVTAFTSDATNLVPNDNNGVDDIFIHNRETLETTRISDEPDENGGDNSSYDSRISGNGRFVVFVSDKTSRLDQIFVHDRSSGQTIRISETSDGNPSAANARRPKISSDGLAVVFESAADDILPGNPSQGDIYLVTLDTSRSTADDSGGTGDSIPPTTTTSPPTTTTSPPTTTTSSNVASSGGGGGSASLGLIFLLSLLVRARRRQARLLGRTRLKSSSATSSFGGIDIHKGIRMSTIRMRFIGVTALTVLIVISLDTTRAQEPEDTPQAIELVEVVGSHLRGVDPEGISPVLVMDRQAIERTGVITVAEVLQQLPMNNAGTFSDRDALSSALGGTGISFRGLGANSVLVLINGRRATTYGFSHVSASGSLVSFVDLNSIPIAAVDRIEILKDGASAIYGSEAMAGVVNIVLREDFTGVELEMRLGTADGSGAEEQAFNVLFGWAMPRTNIEFIATYTKREQLSWTNRAISASANHENQGGIDQRSLAAANFSIDGIGNFGAECEERNTVQGVSGFEEELGFGVCLFDPNSEIVVPSAERAGLMALVNHELTPNLTLHLEASYLSSEAEGRRDSVPWTGGIFPENNPWNPFGQDALADYRFSESGSRRDVIETDNTRMVVALEGELGEWDWDFAALHHTATTKDYGEGYLSADRIEQALNGVDVNGDGTLQQDEYWNLFSPASNPNSLALTNSLAVSTFRRSQTKLTSYTFRMARDLLQLPAGKLSAAFGLERRTDSLDDESDSLSLGSLLAATTDSRFLYGIGIGEPRDEIDPFEHVDPEDFSSSPLEPTGFPSTHGSRSQSSLFGELRIPVLPRLDLQAALRYEDISEFGQDVSPRLALRFNGSDRIRARASWGKSFRAPSPGEMYLGTSTKLQGSWDPKRCPAFPGWVIPERAGGCVVSTFVTATLGNPDLTTEKSESASVGIEVDVFDNHEVSLDCWKVDVHDKILTAQTAWIIRHEDDLPPGTIIRDPLQAWDITDPDMSNTHGTIAQVNVLPLNFGRQEVNGCDVELASVWDRLDGGVLQAQLLATHMASNKLAFGADDPLEELAGTYGYPKNRANLNLFWDKNDWQVGLYGRWTDGFDDTFAGSTVASHTEWDTQISYSGLPTAKLTLGVENLFDEAPPFSVGSFHPQGFPVQFYNMRGRFIYAQAIFSLGGERQAARQR